jgi:hypothetical protein
MQWGTSTGLILSEPATNEATVSGVMSKMDAMQRDTRIIVTGLCLLLVFLWTALTGIRLIPPRAPFSRRKLDSICYCFLCFTSIITGLKFGVPSAKYGEEVMAWLKVRDDHELTEEQIDRFCRGQIATYKIPRYWKFVQEFPMTVSGKIRKVEMREISTKELGLEGVAKIETA